MTSLTALCRTHNIPSLRERLTATGMLTLAEVACDLSAAPATVKKWQRLGLITGRRVDGRREYLYHPGQDCPEHNPRRNAALHRYQTLSEVIATISTARSRHQQPDKTTSSITSSTEGAV